MDFHIYSTTKTYIRFVSVMSKNQGGYYRSEASKLQRLVCIDLTRAMFSTSFKVLDVILNLLPLHEYLLHIKSIRSALRLKRRNNVLSGDLIVHLSILKYFKRRPVKSNEYDGWTRRQLWLSLQGSQNVAYKLGSRELSSPVARIPFPVTQGCVTRPTNYSYKSL